MKRLSLLISLLGCILCAFPFFTACHKDIDYTAFLSENRHDVFVDNSDNYRLKIYAVDKEYPYCTDGYVGEVSSRVEVYFAVKNGGKTCRLTIGEKGEISGEMSYDSVEGEYYFSCAASLTGQTQLPVKIVHGEDQLSLVAHSVKTADTLSSRDVLSRLQQESEGVFSALTKGNQFEGEIYLRLIYESAPYYYVGVIGRDKKTTAFLLDAVSGKLLATKQN